MLDGQAAVTTGAYTVGGVVQGLTGVLQLQNGAYDTLTISANSRFRFNATVSDGSPYNVTVLTQPTDQSCVVTNASGTIRSANVTDIVVICQGAQTQSVGYAVGGSVSGLTGIMQLRNNNNNDIVTVQSNGVFNFDTTLAVGQSYNVSVYVQPTGQLCTVGQGSGTVGHSDIQSILVACQTAQAHVSRFAISGTISGLQSANTIVISDGVETVSVPGTQSSFGFPTSLTAGADYIITVVEQPTQQSCSVLGTASGVVSGPITNIAIACTTLSYPVFVTALNLPLFGQGVVLQNRLRGGATVDTVTLTNTNNSFAVPFPMAVTSGSTYAVSVLSSPGYQCTLGGTASSGTITDGPVTGLTLSCAVILNFTTGQAATHVLGQGDFTSHQANRGGNVDARSINFPQGGAYGAPNGLLYVGDTGNARVLAFNDLLGATTATATTVVGQPDFTTTTPGTTAATFAGPVNVTGNGNMLAITDGANHRVLLYNRLPSAQTNADVVLGQPTFSSALNANINTGSCPSTPYGNLEGSNVALLQSKLVVSSVGNEAVFIYDTLPTTGMFNIRPDVTLGQSASYDALPTCYVAYGGTPTATNLSFPTGVWSDGTRLFVADTMQNRILIWDSLDTAITGQAAAHVMGQPDFTSSAAGTTTSSLRRPTSIASDGTRLFVADAGNNRVLVWNTIPTGTAKVYNAPANAVLGQPDATSNYCNQNVANGTGSNYPFDPPPGNVGTAADTLCAPVAVSVVGTSLVITDAGNHRFVVYDSQ